jgi:hypothetical protein
LDEKLKKQIRGKMLVLVPKAWEHWLLLSESAVWDWGRADGAFLSEIILWLRNRSELSIYSIAPSNDQLGEYRHPSH